MSNKHKELRYARFKLFWEAKRIKELGYTAEDYIYYAENMPEELFSLEGQKALDIIDIDLEHITSVVWTMWKEG